MLATRLVLLLSFIVESLWTHPPAHVVAMVSTIYVCIKASCCILKTLVLPNSPGRRTPGNVWLAHQRCRANVTRNAR
ncbi:hypothetical protein B0H10DRAFT_2073663 [Mycena sp. CBHHK59/15]|nr:hypothetical protein B0H10DRAFT_2073663 [Mycena sp. CBHHK59/15]